MIATVLNQQNQLDLAIQLYGTIEAVFDLVKNNDLGITDNIESGSDIVFVESVLSNKPIKAYYEKNRILPATLKPDVDGLEDINKGVGFAKIEAGFIIT